MVATTTGPCARIMAVADEANRYIDDRKPWEMAKDEDRRDELHAVLTTGVNLFRTLVIYLKAIIPDHSAARAEDFLGEEALSWTDSGTPRLDHPIQRYEQLMTRIDESEVAKMVEESKPEETPPAKAGATPAEAGVTPAEVEATGYLAKEPIAPEIQYDDFAKLDFRVARIVEASHVEGADKLLAASPRPRG